MAVRASRFARVRSVMSPMRCSFVVWCDAVSAGTPAASRQSATARRETPYLRATADTVSPLVTSATAAAFVWASATFVRGTAYPLLPDYPRTLPVFVGLIFSLFLA